jgi:hypothetical protein
MNLPIFVCPFDPALLRRFAGDSVAVRVDRPARIAEAAAAARDSENTLFCVILDSACPLDEIEFGEDLNDTPLAVMAPSLGKFRNLVRHLDRLKRLNLQVYLPCDRAENVAGLRILSSVGIRTCAVIGSGKTDWEALADLMTYAILEPVPHAAIEPFAAIAAGYDPQAWLDWGGAQFEDPSRFLHVDLQGRIALSRAELEESKFIAQDRSELSAEAEHPAVRERLDARRRMFAENHPCASCAGWKVCLGKFAATAAGDRGCEALFAEAMDAALQRQAAKRHDAEPKPWPQ